eukprot:Colp12_sorted_trinity150504_noHs@12278
MNQPNTTMKVGLKGSHARSSHTIPFLVSVKPKFDPDAKVTVWATQQNGMTGLPDKLCVKISPADTCENLYLAILNFYKAEGQRLASGLGGASNVEAFGMKSAGRMTTLFEFNPVIESVAFEGSPLPRNSSAISSFLKEEQDFQVSGKIEQNVELNMKRPGCSII